jgi:hypothetical protein
MKNYLLIPLCLLSVLSFGQSNKFTFQLGSQYELPRKTDDLAFFGNDKDGIINLSLKKEELNIVKFDFKSLNQIDDKIIPLPEATKNFNSEEITDFHNGNYFWIHSDWDKDAGTESLYYDRVDIVSGKLSSTNNKLLSTTRLSGTETKTGFYQFKVTDKYKFNYSQDHTKLLVTYTLAPDSRNQSETNDRIGFQVFDNNLNKLWGNEFTMPYTEAIMDNAAVSVDANGNAYLLAKVYDSEKRREKDKETGLPAYHYEVLKFTKDSKEITHTRIESDNNFINEATLIESPTHDLIIACTYSKSASSKKNRGTVNNTTDGIFLATLNQNGEVVKYKNGYYEFPLADLEKFETDRAKRKMEKKDDYEAPHIKVREVLTQPDGSIFIACEEFYVNIKETYDPNYNTTTISYTYFYNDILASKINADGTFAWLRKIPKNQKKVEYTSESGLYVSYTSSIMTNRIESGPGSLGFKLIADSSGYYFLYLDNKKNMELAEDEAPKVDIDGFGGQLVVAKLNKEGVLSKELLFDTREAEIKIYPTQFNKINNNQFIGRAKVKKNLYEPILITVK